MLRQSLQRGRSVSGVLAHQTKWTSMSWTSKESHKLLRKMGKGLLRLCLLSVICFETEHARQSSCKDP